MELERLMGRYVRLQQVLSKAYTHRPWQAGRIDALAEQLSRTEQAIVHSRDTGERSAVGAVRA